MKITFQGFRLYQGSGITLPQFADHLLAESSAEAEYSFNDHNRLFLFEKDVDPDFYTGLLITAKDQRSFPELRNEKGKISIKVSELAEGSRLMDFNFFVIHKQTFCGVYQYYHASCSPTQFGVFLKLHFWKPMQENCINGRIKELMRGGAWSYEHAEAMAKRQYKSAMKFDLFFKQDDFEKIIKGMAEIKQFEFDISTKQPQQSVFNPTIEFKRVQEHFAFANPSLVDKISSAIGKAVRKNHIERGKIIALDHEGETRTVYLAKNIDGFGEFDFDDVTAEIEVDDLANDFAHCPVIEYLLLAARDHEALFCTPD